MKMEETLINARKWCSIKFAVSWIDVQRDAREWNIEDCIHPAPVWNPLPVEQGDPSSSGPYWRFSTGAGIGAYQDSLQKLVDALHTGTVKIVGNKIIGDAKFYKDENDGYFSAGAFGKDEYISNEVFHKDTIWSFENDYNAIGYWSGAYINVRIDFQDLMKVFPPPKSGTLANEDTPKHVGTSISLTELFDRSRVTYPPKLAAALMAWSKTKDLDCKTPRMTMMKWLEENKDSFEPDTDNDPANEPAITPTAIEKIAEVANWKWKGGRPKKPDEV